MGEGIIPVQKIISEIKESGYEGFFETEILSEELSKTDYFELLEKIKDSYTKIIGDEGNIP